MIRLSTGIKVPSHVRFLPSRESFAGTTPDVGELNVDLSRQRVVLTQLFSKYGDLDRVKHEYTSPSVELADDGESYKLVDLFDRYICMIISGKLKTKRNTRFKPATISAYQFSHRTYSAFVRDHGDVDLKDLDLSGKDAKDKKFLAGKFEEHFDKFGEWMIDQEYSINTRYDVFSVVSFCLNYWSNELFITLPKLKKPSNYHTPIVTLPEEFLRGFVTDRAKMYDKFDSDDKYMWEVVAVMMITSLRISDAVSLKPSNIQFHGGRAYLVKENKKTGKETTLPLPDLISERIRYNIDNYGRVYSLDVTYDGYTRRKLSGFLAKYPEMHVMYSYSRRNHIGEQVEVSGKLCDLVHPHMLRKTAITTMLSNGVSPEHVRFASGHSDNSTSFQRYVGFVEKRHKSEVESYYQKILS
jgi:integrase